MPNGDPNWDENFPKLEAFFAPMADEIIGFAKRHNLRVDKYYHDGPSWSLRFSHPKGGSASIYILMIDATTVGLGSDWHIADYDTDSRSSKNSEMTKMNVSNVDLATTLREILSDTLSWELDAWNEVRSFGGYCPDTFSRAEFEAMSNREPAVRFDVSDDEQNL